MVLIYSTFKYSVLDSLASSLVIVDTADHTGFLIDLHVWLLVIC